MRRPGELSVTTGPEPSASPTKVPKSGRLTGNSRRGPVHDKAQAGRWSGGLGLS